MDIRIFKYLEKTEVEGPNSRFCIWVQGCKKHCEGCFAKHSWSFDGGFLVSIEEIFEKIKQANKNEKIEGITFLGGEPFEQAKALSHLAFMSQKIGLSVLVFTGYDYDFLKNSEDVNIQKLLKNTDLLIDGGFEKDKFDVSRPWVGSSNQNYIFLSDKYKKEDILKYKNKIELRISKNGSFFANGMGDFGKIEHILS